MRAHLRRTPCLILVAVGLIALLILCAYSGRFINGGGRAEQPAPTATAGSRAEPPIGSSAPQTAVLPSPPANCQPQPGGRAPSSAPTAGPLLWVQPEDKVDPLLQQLRSARRSIDVTVYLLTKKDVTAELIAAHRSCVAVRVIVEERPFGGGSGSKAMISQLRSAGVPLKYGNPVFRFTHEKTIVIDGQRAIIMTANLTQSAFTTNREFLVLTSDPAEVREAAAIFEADWRREDYRPTVPSLVVSPNNSREKLLGLIQSARASLEIETEVMADREVTDALSAAASRGVQVRVIMTPPDPDESSYDGLKKLADAGVAVRVLKRPYIHAKIVVADGQRAFVGSENFTATSLDQNRELGVLTENQSVVRRIGQTFQSDWVDGKSFR